MADLFNEPGALKTPPAPPRQPSPQATPTVPANKFDPVQDALAERVKDFKSSGLGKLTGGKQVDISVDLFDSVVRKGSARLLKGVLNTASLAYQGISRVGYGIDKGMEAVGLREKGSAARALRFSDEVAETTRKLGMTEAQKNVFENDQLANMLERMGKDEEAEQVRETGKVLGIEAMTDDEVLDMLDPPGAARSFMTSFAELIPEFAVASKATLPSSLFPKATTLLGKGGVLAAREGPANAVFTLLERDPDSPAGKQITQAAQDAALFTTMSAVTPFAAAGAKAAFQKSKDTVAKILLKKATGEILTKADEATLVRSQASQRMFGEPITKKAVDTAAHNKYLQDLASGYDNVDNLLTDLKGGKVIEIPLSEILPDAQLQQVIDDAAKMGKVPSFPAPQGFADDPIQVILPGGKGGEKFYIQDGIHRYMKALQEGKSTIKAVVQDADTKSLRDYFMRPKSVAPIATDLGDVDLMFQPGAKAAVPFVERVVGGTKDLLNKTHEALVSRFQPLARMESELFQAQGLAKPTVNLAQKFEQVAGAVGKAEGDILRFQKEVGDKVKGMGKEFNQYLFLKRTISRLQDDMKTKSVSKRIVKPDGTSRVIAWSVDKAESALKQLRETVGEHAYAVLESAGDSFHSFMDRTLQLQVQSGRLAPEMYQLIRSKNPFYAPFKVITDLDVLEMEARNAMKGTGKNISTTQKLTQAIKGAKIDEDFFLDDIIETSVNQIYKSRLLAEKNLKMMELAKFVDMPGAEKFMQKMTGIEKPPRGWQPVHVFSGGKDIRLAVSPEIAKAVQGLDKELTGFLANVLRVGAIPLRTGATVANAAFQTVNVAFRDPVRQIILNRYGKSLPEMAKFPIDMARGFFHSMKGNLGDAAGDDLFMQFLDSGAANTSVQRFLTPGTFKRLLEPAPKGYMQKLGSMSKKVLDTVPRFSEALEQTGKLTGFIRATREINKKILGKSVSGVDDAALRTNPEYRKAMEEMVTEVRNFAGSPDFARMGNVGGEVNLLYMFFNARVQGISADLGRLAGKRGPGAAAAWTTASALMLPVVANQMRNQMYFKEDYDQLLDWEKKNYIVIFRNKKFVNEDGQLVREAYRIPKSEVFGLFSDFAEGAVNFGFDMDPRAAGEVAMNMLENIAPVNIDGRDALERGESFLSGMNPLFRVPFEVATGRDMFRHRDVLSEQEEMRSPVNQYGESTPELYKTAGQAMQSVGAPEFLQSPKRLEQIATGITGGAISQFSAPKPLDGRSFWSDFLLTKRFHRSPWINETSAQQEIVDILRKQEDARFILNNEGEKKIQELRNMDMGPRIREMNRLNKENPKLLEKVMDISDKEKKGLTYTDRLALQLGVENGERARYLLKKWSETPKVQQSSFIQEMRKKGIISDKVWDQMRALRSSTP